MRAFMLLAALALALAAGCAGLRDSSPLLAQKDYERMLVGRFDADYVGTENCLRACHEHDRIRQDFEASTMGAQMSHSTRLSMVDCESCHGPGSMAIEGITEESVKADAAGGIRTKCKSETLIDLKALPKGAMSLLCLKCHASNATFNLHNWNAGQHASADVTCVDCHKVHSGANLIVKPRDTFAMCFGCHEDIGVEFSMPSHHPVYEKRMFCTDCHDPHGTPEAKLLRKPTVKATCARCHADKEGPYLFEHADVTDDCTTCHSPHGSVNDNLLVENMPYLCLQCHEGHKTTTLETTMVFYKRCTDCHSAIHGSDVPSASGKGSFLQ